MTPGLDYIARELGGSLRLTKKYGLTSLHKQLVEAFERSVPKSLDEWDKALQGNGQWSALQIDAIGK